MRIIKTTNLIVFNNIQTVNPQSKTKHFSIGFNILTDFYLLLDLHNISTKNIKVSPYTRIEHEIFWISETRSSVQELSLPLFVKSLISTH